MIFLRILSVLSSLYCSINIGMFLFSLRMRLSSNSDPVGCSSLNGMKGALAASAKASKQRSVIRWIGFNIQIIRVYGQDLQYWRPMVKKERKLFVWQKPQPKIRKAREARPKKAYEADGREISAQEMASSHSIQQDKQEQKMQRIVNQKAFLIESNSEQRQIRNSANRQLKYQRRREELDQRLKKIKQILYAEERALQANMGIDEYRAFECNQIRAFLNKPPQEFASNILYIYGTPGSGKTFTVKCILRGLGLEDSAKWVNCLAMPNKSLLRYTEPQMEPSNRKTIMVIDQFDQMEKQFNSFRFQRSFKSYLKEVLTKSCSPRLSDIKFIFISNKSCQSISEGFVDAIKEMIRADTITQIPFLPYSPSDIFKILKRKTEEIGNAVGGQAVFPDGYLEVLSKREYANFQDVRKVISLIYQNYENGEMRKLHDGCSFSREGKGVSEHSPTNLMIQAMPLKQRAILQKLIKNCELSLEKKQCVLVEWLYKQGMKCSVPSGTVDLWLREWEEGGLITLRPYHRDGHQLYRTQSIICHLSYDDHLPTFMRN